MSISDWERESHNKVQLLLQDAITTKAIKLTPTVAADAIDGIDDLAEAYLEAFRELVGIDIGGKMYFYVPCKGYVSNEVIEVYYLLLDLAEDEGWDVEEMSQPKKWGLYK